MRPTTKINIQNEEKIQIFRFSIPMKLTTSQIIQGRIQKKSVNTIEFLVYAKYNWEGHSDNFQHEHHYRS